MKKIIYNKFDKREIASMPRAVFPGKIVVVTKPADAASAVDALLASEILGVDTETRPAFRKGARYKVALLQVSTHDTCYLFRLNKTGLTPDIKRFLEDTTVPKIGISWHDDLLGLHKLADFKPGLFIDLQNMVGKLGIEDLSLQKLYANIFHQKISKAQRLSNWEAPVLREPQLLYAATDAWTCINLYEEMERLISTGDYTLVVREDDSTAVSTPPAAGDQQKSDGDEKSTVANARKKTSPAKKKKSGGVKAAQKNRKKVKPAKKGFRGLGSLIRKIKQKMDKYGI